MGDRPVNSYWQKISPRERRLVVITGALILVAFVYLIGLGAVSRLRALDRTVEQLEDQVLSYKAQIAVSKEVDAAYDRIASQHSSTWTEAQIFDRLFQEIYRLALKNPPELGSQEKMTAHKPADYLVIIPSLRQGSLNEEQEDWREYTIKVKPNPTDLKSITAFLQRIMESPQALRVDALELSRPVSKNDVGVVLDVTRTVVDGIAELQDNSESGQARAQGVAECLAVASAPAALAGPPSTRPN